MESQVLSELQVLTDEQQQQVCGGGFNKADLTYPNEFLRDSTERLKARLDRLDRRFKNFLEKLEKSGITSLYA